MDAWEATALSSKSNTVLPTFGAQIDVEWVLPYNIYPQMLFGFKLMSQPVRIFVAAPELL